MAQFKFSATEIWECYKYLLMILSPGSKNDYVQHNYEISTHQEYDSLKDTPYIWSQQHNLQELIAQRGHKTCPCSTFYFILCICFLVGFDLSTLCLMFTMLLLLVILWKWSKYKKNYLNAVEKVVCTRKLLKSLSNVK